MPQKQDNSAWERFSGEVNTDQAMIRKALRSPDDIKRFMLKYKSMVFGYLDWFLNHYKLVPADSTAEASTHAIWAELMDAMPEKLAEKWNRGNIRFRDLLVEGIHETYLRLMVRPPYRPGIDGLVLPSSESQMAWLKQERKRVIEEAAERLKAYQEERQSDRNQYYTVFTVWDAHRDEPLAKINERLGKTPGGHRYELEESFRQALGRACDKFGKFLHDAVVALAEERDECSQNSCRDLFEELNLMDDYAIRSKSCRALLGIDK